MFNRKRIIVAFGALALASGSAFADAFADGTSDVTAMLINIGTNSNGGTGSQIAESIFSMDNADFNFLYGGPGSTAETMPAPVWVGALVARTPRPVLTRRRRVSPTHQTRLV